MGFMYGFHSSGSKGWSQNHGKYEMLQNINCKYFFKYARVFRDFC